MTQTETLKSICVYNDNMHSGENAAEDFRLPACNVSIIHLYTQQDFVT